MKLTVHLKKEMSQTSYKGLKNRDKLENKLKNDEAKPLNLTKKKKKNKMYENKNWPI